MSVHNSGERGKPRALSGVLTVSHLLTFMSQEAPASDASVDYSTASAKDSIMLSKLTSNKSKALATLIRKGF